MSEKRKDSKGRILKTGESQRKDLIYQYRCTDQNGKRRTVYASTLTELRAKEKELQALIDSGINIGAGEITVIELVKKYTDLKKGVRYSTLMHYKATIQKLSVEKFGMQKICNIKMSDAKEWVMNLSKNGLKYNSIGIYKGILTPAFQMAYEEDAIRKNPFDFKLSSIIANDFDERMPLTKEQQQCLIEFLENDKVYKKHADIFIILLNTGIRVSELCGLTLSDLDFENRVIDINKQLLMKQDGSCYVGKPKTQKGYRKIPMSQNVYRSFKNVVENRHCSKEQIVDGYDGFLFLAKGGRPKTSIYIQATLRRAVQKYNRKYPTAPLPRVTPHILRHTFCSNMANAGMNIKMLQYVMGHSDISVTMDVYTKADNSCVTEQMLRIIDGDS